MRLHRCPTCDEPGIEVIDVPTEQKCPACNSVVYPSDCLRLWEEVGEYQSNTTAMSRFMSLVEHLLPIHYMKYLLENSPRTLSGLAVFVDGPLAVFGTSAWLHGAILRFLGTVRERLSALGQAFPLIIGLQKTGQIVDHILLIERFLPVDSLFAIDDDYRYKYIIAGRDPADKGFGENTYYGQDFIYKTPTGRVFVFAIPYPFSSKSPSSEFIRAKTHWGNYAELPRALAVIKHFESDLYENAVVPIALAHRYTAISLVPGAAVLDVLTKQALS